MRIISGTHRGRKLAGFDGDEIRPTTDRVKESMFNLIADFVPNASVLDLFSGSGALALEALSRGAKSAVCVDLAKKSIEIIRKNVENLKFQDNVYLVHSSAVKYLDAADCKFDIIFLDPPYNRGFIKPVIRKIVDKGVLSDRGIIVLESDFTDEHDEVAALDIYKQRKYGRTYITIYKKGETI
ncbi:MAG: 16S rRNA (guanine(966)-N(2))-methyltransferase RsmD [Clostridia bacterium]|nr:16S rRNA (guanine(966)-N(2))-methyltransferase RsmD [Clostridia bacterium]